MQLGPFTIEQLSEGLFEIFDDGHINRITSEEREELEWGFTTPAESSVAGINPVFVRVGKNNIVIDPGLGWGLDAGSDYTDVSNILTNLQIFDVAPEEITHVILSHLHYDHAAGSTYTDTRSKVQPVFPNAVYYMHEKEWEYALSQSGKAQRGKGAGYVLDDLYRLVADGAVEFTGENVHEVIPGVTILWTGGHTPGHQVVRIGKHDQYAYYLGDLLPTEHHLNHYALHQMDTDPVQAKKKKIQLLRQACKEEAVMLFFHSKYARSGKLVKNRDKQYVLKD